MYFKGLLTSINTHLEGVLACELAGLLRTQHMKIILITNLSSKPLQDEDRKYIPCACFNFRELELIKVKHCACGPCRYFLLFVLCYVKTKWAQMASLFIHSGREINIDQITTYYIRIHLIEQIGTYLDSSGSFLTSAQSKSPRQKHTIKRSCFQMCHDLEIDNIIISI